MARILILSENSDDLAMYNLILERQGYDCITCTTLENARSYLQNSDIDVLYIVGFHYFGRDGLEFYERLKSDTELCKIPVIIYTPWWPSTLKLNPSDFGDTLFVMPKKSKNLQVIRSSESGKVINLGI